MQTTFEVFFDGVPVAENDEMLNILNPDSVERIEVIPGPNILCSASRLGFEH